jgi:hypothetical protein
MKGWFGARIGGLGFRLWMPVLESLAFSSAAIDSGVGGGSSRPRRPQPARSAPRQRTNTAARMAETGWGRAKIISEATRGTVRHP